MSPLHKQADLWGGVFGINQAHRRPEGYSVGPVGRGGTKLYGSSTQVYNVTMWIPSFLSIMKFFPANRN